MLRWWIPPPTLKHDIPYRVALEQLDPISILALPFCWRKQLWSEERLFSAQRKSSLWLHRPPCCRKNLQATTKLRGRYREIPCYANGNLYCFPFMISSPFTVSTGISSLIGIRKLQAQLLQMIWMIWGFQPLSYTIFWHLQSPAILDLL